MPYYLSVYQSIDPICPLTFFWRNFTCYFQSFDMAYNIPTSGVLSSAMRHCFLKFLYSYVYMCTCVHMHVSVCWLLWSSFVSILPFLLTSFPLPQALNSTFTCFNYLLPEETYPTNCHHSCVHVSIFSKSSHLYCFPVFYHVA